MNARYARKTRKAFKSFVLTALVTAILGCNASPGMNSTGKVEVNENRRIAQKESSGTSSAAAKISDGSDSTYAPEAGGETPANADNTVESVEQPATAETIVRHDGFGKIKVGMAVAQASQASGAKFVRGKGYENACYYVDSPKLKGVRLMVTSDKIARIDISSNKYVTDKGARIGDTEDKIKKLYPGINVYPQKYDEKKHDLEISSGDQKYLIIFETDGRRVTSFRVGKTEEVGYVEGCS